MAARLIFLTKKRDHITFILRDQLHWLPIEQRMQFKILLLTYKAFHGAAPIIFERSYYCGLRAGNVRPKTCGERAFAVAAPALWNAVSIDIRISVTVAQFKARLKTHLFKVTFLE